MRKKRYTSLNDANKQNAFQGLCGEYAVAALAWGLTINAEHYAEGGDGGKGDIRVSESFMIGVKTRDWFGDYLTNTDDKADFQDTHGVIVWRCDGKSTPEQYQEETPNRLLVKGFLLELLVFIVFS